MLMGFIGYEEFVKVELLKICFAVIRYLNYKLQVEFYKL